MMTPKIAQIALRFGADDHRWHRGRGEDLSRCRGHDAAGHDSLCRLITEAGRVPVERDTLYNAVTRTEDSFTVAV
jgi:aminodeoxyfutalosine synthase